jgi:hypothetical protein
MFLGEEFTAEVVVFVVDRSASMQDSGELARARQLLIDVLPASCALNLLAVRASERFPVRFPVRDFYFSAASQRFPMATANCSRSPGSFSKIRWTIR